MTAVLTSPEAIINDALVRIGYKRRIGSVWEGSEPAKVALDIYGQTRDQMLRDGDWGFARRDLTLTLLKSAPANGFYPTGWTNTYPPVPWSFEYSYPADCLKIRSIKLPPLFIPNYLPKAVNFSISNDNSYTPAKKVVLCNVGPSALAVYTAQVTDPSTWEASFSEALSAELARRLAPALANLDLAKIEAGDEIAETGAAMEQRG